MIFKLGLRFAVGSEDKSRTLTVISACAVLGFALIIGYFFIQSNFQSEERVSSRTPNPSFEAQATMRAFQTTDIFQDRAWNRTLFSSLEKDNEVSPPTGFNTFPDVGETFVSPALLKLLKLDPQLESRVPGMVAGIIPEQSLAEPNELASISNVASLESGYFSNGWGGIPLSEALLPSPVFICVAIFLLGLPMFVLFIGLGRLSSQERKIRTERLELLGVTSSDVMRVLRVEAVTLSGIGVAIGMLFGWICSVSLGRLGVNGVSWFTNLSLQALLVLFILALIVVVGAAKLWTATATNTKTMRQRGFGRYVALFAVLVGVLIPASNIIPQLVKPSSDQALVFDFPILYLGLILSSLGFAYLLPLFSSKVIVKTAQFFPEFPKLIGIARAKSKNSGGNYANLGVFVCVFGIVAATGFAEVVGVQASDAGVPGSYIGVQTGLIDTQTERKTVVNEFSDSMFASIILTKQSFQQTQRPDELNNFIVVVGDCSVLKKHFGIISSISRNPCENGNIYYVDKHVGGAELGTAETHQIEDLFEDKSFTLNRSEDKLRDVFNVTFGEVLAVITTSPENLSKVPANTTLIGALGNGTVDKETVINRAYQSSDQTEIYLSSMDKNLFLRMEIVQAAIILFGVLGIVAGILAVIIAEVNNLRERRRESTQLMIIGAGKLDRMRLLWLSGVPPICVSALGAGLIGWIGTVSFLQQIGTLGNPPKATTTMIICVVVAALAIFVWGIVASLLEEIDTNQLSSERSSLSEIEMY